MVIDIIYLKVLFAIAIVGVILLAGWYPFRTRYHNQSHLDLPIGETLATGVFLGAGLIHMLPEAAHQFQQLHYHYPYAYLIAGGVFLFFLWFEHLGKEIYHHQHNAHPAFAILAWAMLSIHSLMLGTALGFNHQSSLVIMLFLAIITHKWAESFAIAIQLNKSSLSLVKRITFFLSFSLMTPLGMIIGWFFDQGIGTNYLLNPILMAASAGTFLYLGTLHGLERCVLVERCCNLRDFSFVIIGFLLMALVAAYI